MSSFRGHAADGAAAPLGGLQMIASPRAGKSRNSSQKGNQKSHIGRNERSRKSDFMLSGNGDRVQNEAMIGGAESE